MCDNEELITYNYYLMIFLGDKIFEAVVLESLKKSEEWKKVCCTHIRTLVFFGIT